MNIFFDVDYTIIGYDGSLRPHVIEVMEQLKADGHTIYLWSGVGLRHEVVNQHKMHHLITECYVKPTWDYVNGLKRHNVPLTPDFVIDDHNGVVKAFGGFWVSRWEGYPPGPDDEMKQVYEAIRAKHLERTAGENA
ncbi:MAG: hypothetical protein NTZ05_08290 [Chloroflexi bacterium]|nr:hypothetical protein [Chloroflexota bacterium]